MRLGVIPLALQFSLSVATWMVKSRISSAIAAEQAAAEFDYFKRVSDAELTAVAFQMAKDYPQYPYFEWFRILEDLRAYGSLTPGIEPGQLPGADLPDRKADDKKPTSYTWLLVALGVIVFVLVTEG